MHDGLHIGLAAWIDAQQAPGGFPAWPASPTAFKVANLETVQTMADLIGAAEFAHMVNFRPRKGQYAGVFADPQVLWGTHRDLLGRMVFAVRAWSTAENDEWEAARGVLYEAGPGGFPVMTAAFRFYDELRLAYEELVAGGAGPADLAAAQAAWLTMGDKTRIEAALATMLRLARRSSLSQAENERVGLEPELLAATPDGSYAPTAFSPVSAVREDTWLTAEATFAELDQAVGTAEPRAKWTAWRAARVGSVRFRYAVLQVRRAWFTAALYEADDWRFAEPGEVSSGDGVHGELPAYVQRVYVVRVEALKVQSAVPPRGEPELAVPLRSRPLRTALEPRALARDPGADVATQRPAARDPAGPGDMVVLDPVVRPVALATTREPALMARAAVFGRVQRVALPEFAQRLSIAHAVLEGGARPEPGEPRPPDPPAADPEPYVVGFGCSKVPTAPIPNPDYQWNFS
jgi:hypothetical protein